ncbi:hypothetical protein JCM10207_006531 [Rhodosporidiobolus poonsookiae]
MATLPPADQLLDSIRTSCHACTTRSLITIDDEAIDSYLLSIDQQQWDAGTGPEKHGVRLPLRFDSPDDELNLFSVLALLNFLSGYRTALHRLTGRGAYSTILSLVLSAYLAGTDTSSPSLLSTAGMLAATPASLAGLARIQTHTEKDHPTLGAAVRVGEKDAEAWEILELLTGVLNETGGILQGLGKKDLGSWVREKLEQTNGDAGAMVRELAEAFPAFRDVHVVDGEPVFIFKKALWLLAVVSLRFSTESPPPFPLPKLDDFPVFADNVLPTLLLHHSILSLSTSSDPALSSLSATPSAPLPSTSATRLRAAAVTACAALVRRAHALAAENPAEHGWMSGWTEQRLDGWLWGEGKREGLRDVERVAERGTVFY